MRPGTAHRTAHDDETINRSERRRHRRVMVAVDGMVGDCLAFTVTHGAGAVTGRCSPNDLGSLTTVPTGELPHVLVIDDLAYAESFGHIECLARQGVAIVAMIDPARRRDVAGARIVQGTAPRIAWRSDVDGLLEALNAAATANADEADTASVVNRRGPAHPRAGGRPAALAQLTDRECDVLLGMMDGRNAQQLASSYVVSVTTIRSHIRSILRKLAVNSQLEAVAIAYRSGWLFWLEDASTVRR